MAVRGKILLLVMIFVLHSSVAEARLGGTLGTTYSLGSLSSNDSGSSARGMNAFSLEVLPGYWVNESLLVGIDFSYRWLGQFASVSGTQGTNLKGQEWLLGFGASYVFSQCIRLQGGIYFLGQYHFGKQTSSAEDDHLSGPLSLRAKAQWMFLKQPALSLDFDLQYLSYRNFIISDLSYSISSQGFLAGLGVTWHLGGVTMSSSEVQLPPEPGALTKQEISKKDELSELTKAEPTEKGIKFNLQAGESFDSGSSELREQAQFNLAKIARIVASRPYKKIRIEGHTDSSGSKKKNLVLSKERAQAVRVLFIAQGIHQSTIEAQGFGDTVPLVSNSDSEGRAKNRRVEIYIEN